MVNKKVKKSLSKFKLRLSIIFNFLTHFKKIACKVMMNIKSCYSNFLNSILFSNQSKILEVKE